jgi:hypothetical protein
MLPGVAGMGDSFNNLCISCAPAYVSSKGFFDGLFIRIRDFIEQGIRCHEHARGAEPALDSPVINKGLL